MTEKIDMRKNMHFTEKFNQSFVLNAINHMLFQIMETIKKENVRFVMTLFP